MSTENQPSVFQEVTELKGVGPKTAESLNKLGIFTIYDLLHHYPLRFDDFRQKNIGDIEDKEKVVIKGQVLAEPVVNFYGRRRSRLTFRIVTDRVVVPVVFFNQHWLKDAIHRGEEAAVYGTWDGRYRQLNGHRLLDQEKDGQLSSVYPSNKEITSNKIQSLIKQAFSDYGDSLQGFLPKELREKYQLLSEKEALGKIHFPRTGEDYDLARRTLKFVELLLYQIQIQILRAKKRDQNEAYRVDYQIEPLKAYLGDLPFELTGAQKRSINEICADLKQPYEMYRMLQGDVGSGKTLVAAAAIYATFTAHKQAALMAPTEILAKQHYDSLKASFESTELRVELLTSSTAKAAREHLLRELEEGKVDLLIGTHALIQEDVNFKSLALAIVDEEHRFGVDQRRALADKGAYTNKLTMTATPIPRTLAITAFGDYDMSILNELPPGRKPVRTQWLQYNQETYAFQAVNQALEEGSQVYVVSPLIEESADLDLETVTDTYDKYVKLFKDKAQVGILHGRQTAEEKEAVLSTFKDGSLDIIVSTTVIEVGVDVPNATLMIIYDADRFGLAQLHQLRGRIGRGQKPGLCLMLAQPKSEQGVKRMQLMEESRDGFYLSQKDLEMRGPGDVLGKRQSGLPDFKLASLQEDTQMLELARQEAQSLVQQDSFPSSKLYRQVQRIYSNA